MLPVWASLYGWPCSSGGGKTIQDTDAMGYIRITENMFKVTSDKRPPCWMPCRISAVSGHCMVAHWVLSMGRWGWLQAAASPTRPVSTALHPPVLTDERHEHLSVSSTCLFRLWRLNRQPATTLRLQVAGHHRIRRTTQVLSGNRPTAQAARRAPSLPSIPQVRERTHRPWQQRPSDRHRINIDLTRKCQIDV